MAFHHHVVAGTLAALLACGRSSAITTTERQWAEDGPHKVHVASMAARVLKYRGDGSRSAEQVSLNSPSRVDEFVSLEGVFHQENPACGDFAFTPTAASTRPAETLLRQGDSLLYGCSRTTARATCRVLRRIPAAHAPIPAEWSSQLDVSTIVAVLVEFEVAVSGDNDWPTESIPLKGRPVAIETTSGPRDIRLDGFEGGCAGAKGEAFQVGEFDFSNCEKRGACRDRVWTAFASYARRTLVAEPFGATEVPAEARRTNELVFRRLGQRSLVLGRPWIENAYYRAEFWWNEPRGPEARFEEYPTGGLRIELFLLLKKSPRPSEHYREAESEMERYNVELQKLNMLADVCRAAGGVSTGNQCRL